MVPRHPSGPSLTPEKTTLTCGNTCRDGGISTRDPLTPSGVLAFKRHSADLTIIGYAPGQGSNSSAVECHVLSRCDALFAVKLRSRDLDGVIFMGWSRKRSGQKGKVHYTAFYRDGCGKTCAAGTFTNKKDADKAWQTAEVRQAEGRLGDPRRGKQMFQLYVEAEWLPNHVIEVTTREGYTYSIGKHIMPWFGPLRMNQVMPSDVREW